MTGNIPELMMDTRGTGGYDGDLSMTKEARPCNGGKTVSPTHGAGKTGQLHVKG